MNHITLALVAVLAAAAIVIGTMVSPAFALESTRNGISVDRQDDSNCIGVANGANTVREPAIIEPPSDSNACRQGGSDEIVRGPPT